MHPIRNIMGIDQHTFHLDFGWGYDCHWLPIMIIFAVQIVLCSSAIYDVITYYKSLPLICCLPNAFIINCILVMPGLSVLEPVQWCPRQGSTDSPDMGNDASTLMKQADLAIENWLFTLNRWVLICFNISGCFMRIEPSTNREFYRNLYIESWGQNIKYGDFTFQKKEHILTKQELLRWFCLVENQFSESSLAWAVWFCMVRPWWFETHYCIYTIVWFKCPKPLGPLDGLLHRPVHMRQYTYSYIIAHSLITDG